MEEIELDDSSSDHGIREPLSGSIVFKRVFAFFFLLLVHDLSNVLLTLTSPFQPLLLVSLFLIDCASTHPSLFTARRDSDDDGKQSSQREFFVKEHTRNELYNFCSNRIRYVPFLRRNLKESGAE